MTVSGEPAENKPKVLVVGSGGVGTICALSLTVRDRSEVTLVVRSDYDQVTSKGFTINSCTYGKIEGWRPHHIAKSVTEAREKYGEFDYILVTTKNIPDGQYTCEEIIKPAVSEKSTIILVQNGLSIEEPMIKEFPNNIILSGITLIGSTNYNGVIENKGPDNVFIGDFKPEAERNPNSAKVIEKFIHIYQNDNGLNKIQVDTDVQKTRWEKLVYNCVFNTITALVDLDVSRAQTFIGNDTLFRPAMKEVIAIAKSAGVEVTPTIPEKFIHIGDGLFYSPSMCVDMRKKQPMELEVILGNPLKIAAKNGVPTPILSTVYQLLTLVQYRIKEANGLFTIDKSLYKGDSDKANEIFREHYKH
ncbi:2-dehydropantoate 2-reductase [Scheffersomyces xylosifermentans]|uniref:2-dehydropantoate 2-reductase n=1 Tax=Scheffersomyces xylosifermentans TaxID=1304137 RepID=UPI00315DA0BE